MARPPGFANSSNFLQSSGRKNSTTDSASKRFHRCEWALFVSRPAPTSAGARAMSTAGSPTSVALEPNIRRPKAPRMTSVRCRASTSGGGPGQTVAIIGRGRVGLRGGRGERRRQWRAGRGFGGGGGGTGGGVASGCSGGYGPGTGGSTGSSTAQRTPGTPCGGLQR